MLQWMFGLILAATLAVHSSPVLANCAGVASVDDGATDVVGNTCASPDIQVPEGKGTTYRVGSQQPFVNIADVPWYMLKAGDTVYIHHRDLPYREKILISTRGTPEQWIRVLGVPSAKGERPVISGDGAVTGPNMRYRWQNPKLVQFLGLVQVAIGADSEGEGHRPPPGYIEIANLQVQDAYATYSFTAENGATTSYDGFAACIYARSVQHLIVRNNVLTNCGQGFYNWTGDGSTAAWHAALQQRTILAGNHFFNNGHRGSYREHQVYTESDGVTIEYNRFGPMRKGARGSQIKDRSVGTVIRYNTIEQAEEGWDIDLVEPEESWSSLRLKGESRHAFVYNNVIISKGVDYPNIVHWNEDHQAGRGRATLPGAKLLFYHNTIVIHAVRSDTRPYTIFNSTWGSYDCPPSDLPGVIDARNNIIAVVPRLWTTKLTVRLGYCGKERILLGGNWITPSIFHKGPMTGLDTTVSPSANDPGFRSGNDFRLKPGASATGAGHALAPEVTSNALKSDFTPRRRFIDARVLGPRPTIGSNSDPGAY